MTSPLDTDSHRFCIAPMMDWSDRHCRYLWRLLSRHTRLYTEMVTTGALIHGNFERLLAYNPEEHPVALQLGGSDPSELARCARLAAQWGYDEVNLNCGCPSDRVQRGMIGACLMAEPQLVADCVAAMREACDTPVTVKHRIGIDDMDEYTAMRDFVGIIADSGCDTFIVHARKAWLKGLSPKENRDKPPLRYEQVYRLKQEFPHLRIVINGGITSLEQSRQMLERVDGVMLGREASSNPYLLAGVDSALFNDTVPAPSRETVLRQFADYCERQCARGERLHSMTRHLMGLFLGQPGAKAFRRHLSTEGIKADADVAVLHHAADHCLPLAG